MPVVTIPKTLREKLGEDASDGLVQFINKAAVDTRENILVQAEDKFEKRLIQELSKLRIDLDKRITEEVATVRVEMASFKAEIIKWMFLFWIGYIVIIAGLIKFIR